MNLSDNAALVGCKMKLDFISKLFNYLNEKGLKYELAEPMLEVLYEHPRMRYGSILLTLNFKELSIKDISAPLGFLFKKFSENKDSIDKARSINWLMGQVRKQAIGNINLTELHIKVSEFIETKSK